MSYLFVVSVLCLFLSIRAKPCPQNSVFLYSDYHNKDFCVCLHGLKCVGDDCSLGSDVNIPSFQSHHHGFPATSLTGKCVNEETGIEYSNDVNLSKLDTKTGVPDHTDSLYDEVCVTEPNVIPPAPRALKTMNWVHIPKCGTSLTSLIYNYACQSEPLSGNLTHPNQDAPMDQTKPGSWSSELTEYSKNTCSYCWKTCEVYPRCTAFTEWAPHDGLLRTDSTPFTQKMCASRILGNVPGHTPLMYGENLRGSYIGTFRDPRKRLLSAFNYGRHAMGMSKQGKKALKRTKSLAEFARYDGIASCQTKMVLGFKCAQQGMKLNAGLLKEAKRRLREEFAFVGITEYWKASVCLFHRMYGGAVHKHSFRNMRPTDDFIEELKTKGYTFVAKDEWERMPLSLEAFDWELYKTARSIFVENLEKYGIALPIELVDELQTSPDSIITVHHTDD